MIQIVPTEKIFHIPFIYERRKWGYPYSISIVLESNKPIETDVMIHYIKLTADEEVLLNEEYSKPLILKCIKPYSTYEYYKLEHHQELGELLKFEQGKKVELEVTVEIPGVFEKKTIKMKGVGEESKDSTWLFLAYLSV